MKRAAGMVRRSGSKPELACERIGGMKYADTAAPVIGCAWRLGWRRYVLILNRHVHEADEASSFARMEFIN